MAKQRGRESNTGIVVTLVFFIILSIALGVAAYYGFAGQTASTAKETAAVAAEKDVKSQRDWYQFQAWTYRTYLGQTEGIDDAALKVAREGFDLGTVGKDSKGEFPDRAAVKNLITKVESAKYQVAVQDPKTKAWTLQDRTMAWDANTKRPKYSYEEIYKGLFNLHDYFDQQLAAAQHAKDEADAARKTADDAKAKADADYAKQIADAAAKNAADLVAQQKTIDKLNEDLKAADVAKNDAVKAEADKTNEIAKGVGAKEKLIREQDAKIKEMRDRLEQSALGAAESPTNGKPISTNWKIVKMDRSGKEPFINLGRADNVRPPLTFSIHGRGPEGKPMSASKGTLEVINVTGDHLAQAKVVSVKDALKDPILEGDFLYNPVFHAGAPQHVVIAGLIDMHGVKGQDDTPEFERLLQRQNVVVDGSVNLTDASIIGKLSSVTDVLILGDESGAKPEVQASIKQLKDLARSNGVPIIRASTFLESIGYRKP